MSRGNGNSTALMPATGTEILDSDGGEVFDLRDRPSALESVTRAELDVQISTAKAYPRSIDRFLKDAITMVSINPELAAGCTYALPARGKDGKEIAGPSVRLAEIVAVCWGNLRVVGRVIDDDGKSITAQGIVIDLQANLGYSVEVRRGVTTNKGYRFSNDMVNVTCNAAIAIATRNATFKAVPKAFVSIIEEKAKQIARGDGEPLFVRTTRALDWCKSVGLKEEEVFKTLGVGGFADITIDHLAKLNEYRAAITDGEASVDEIFRAQPEASPQQTPTTATAATETTPPTSKTEALKNRLKGQHTQPGSLLPDPEPEKKTTRPDAG